MLVITYNNSFEDVNSEDEFDKIEILSSQIETADEFFLAPIASLTEKEVDLLDRKERERKRIARAVALISGILFLVSVALVTVSLYMAKDIDEMVRNSNEMLRKHNDRISGMHVDGSTGGNMTGL
ncbi:uncharacterized protein LOC123561592 [Mercenaria mercenaria]|uniref:uncharacterized protein LOC123561592 n=1 Tax=Mercenaria mercenaria TaxID=6596 RepID=UPI00234F35DF|nr:uncharacterized protein LOC123561592 [Mercenaria mercenaria]